MTTNIAPQQPETNNSQPPISETRLVAPEVIDAVQGTNSKIHDNLDQAKLRELTQQIELSIKENGEKLAAIGQMINEVCGEGYVK